MDVEFCQNLFLNLLRWSYDFNLEFVNVVYHISYIILIDLWILNDSCSPRINLTLPCCMILSSMYCSIWFTNILLRIFVSMFIGVTDCNFLFCNIFIWFSYQVMLTWKTELRINPFSEIFWNILRIISDSSSVNVW